MADKRRDLSQPLASAAGVLGGSDFQPFGSHKFVECPVAPARMEINGLEHEAFVGVWTDLTKQTRRTLVEDCHRISGALKCGPGRSSVPQR